MLFISLGLNSQNLVEKIAFQSANPFSFHDVITDLENQEKQEVYGNLVIPYDSLNPDKKYPLVLGVAGSLGWKNHHYEYLTMYQNLGFATFELNSFKSRRIESTVGDQTQVTTAAMILDAYRALEILSDHPNIKKDKISITGWSLGGAVTFFSAWIPLKNAINKNLQFASHLAFYPPCFFEPENFKRPIKISYDLIDAKTKKKLLSKGDKLNYVIAKKLSEKNLKNILISPQDILGKYVANDLKDNNYLNIIKLFKKGNYKKNLIKTIY